MWCCIGTGVDRPSFDMDTTDNDLGLAKCPPRKRLRKDARIFLDIEAVDAGGDDSEQFDDADESFVIPGEYAVLIVLD